MCVCVCARLLLDAQDDAHYQSWFSKVQAALRHGCGRALRQELDLEQRLVTLLTHVAERVRIAEKARRKASHTHTAPMLKLSQAQGVCIWLEALWVCVLWVELSSHTHSQDVLKRERWKIAEFFRNGVTCRLPLDPAVLVKAVEVDVR